MSPLFVPATGRSPARPNPLLVGLVTAAVVGGPTYLGYRLGTGSPTASDRPIRMRSVARAAMDGAAAVAPCDLDGDAARSAGRAAMNRAAIGHAWHGFADVLRSAARAGLHGTVTSHACQGFDRDARSTGGCSGIP